MASTQILGMFLLILVETVKSLLRNDSRLLMAKHKFWTFLTQNSENQEISSKNW